VWRLVYDNMEDIRSNSNINPDTLDGDAKDLWRQTHHTIDGVSRDIEDRFHFNTAIAKIMILSNRISELAAKVTQTDSGRAALSEAARRMIVLLSPFAPHISEELWEAIGEKRSLSQVLWPSADPKALEREEILIVVQVNGKLRGRVTVPADADPEEIKRVAQAEESVSRHTKGKKIKKVVYVPGKLVNVVVN